MLSCLTNNKAVSDMSLLKYSVWRNPRDVRTTAELLRHNHSWWAEVITQFNRFIAISHPWISSCEPISFGKHDSLCSSKTSGECHARLVNRIPPQRSGCGLAEGLTRWTRQVTWPPNKYAAHWGTGLSFRSTTGITGYTSLQLRFSLKKDCFKLCKLWTMSVPYCWVDRTSRCVVRWTKPVPYRPCKRSLIVRSQHLSTTAENMRGKIDRSIQFVFHILVVPCDQKALWATNTRIGRFNVLEHHFKAYHI